MNEKIKISIVVPIYNLQDYIERCVKSILAQSHANLELLVVDDGSTDNSRQVIEKLVKSDKRIVPIFKKNGGVTSARLAGIEKATGDWIGFVDGDDEIESDMYERLLKNAVKYDADISHCGYQMIFSDGRVSYFHNTGCLRKQDRITGIKDLLDGTFIEPGLCNKLFRKKLFQNLLQNKVLNKDIKINEDLLMNYILFEQSDLSIYEDVCKYHYIVRENSASRAKLNEHKIFDPIRVKKIIMELSDKELLRSAQKAYLSTCINVYNSLTLTNEDVSKELLKVRNIIIGKRAWISLIDKKQMILGFIILYFPWAYRFLYRGYVKYIMKNPYE